MTRALLEQALEAMTPLQDLIILRQACEAIRAHLAKSDTAPAWHDAPTVPGLWCSSVWNARHFSLDDVAKFSKRPAFPHWFGPIPEDSK